MAKLISVTNKKGGVGKTSATIFICTALARIGYKVALLDCDSQSSAFDYRNIEANEYEQEKKEFTPVYPIIKSEPEDVLNKIGKLKNSFDYIFFDIPRFTEGKGDSLLGALVTLCDKILVPTKSGELDNISTVSFIRMLHLIQKRKSEKGKDLDFCVFLSLSGKRPSYDTITRGYMKSNKINILDSELMDTTEYVYPSTHVSLLDTSSIARKRFLPFFKEVCSFIDADKSLLNKYNKN